MIFMMFYIYSSDILQSDDQELNYTLTHTSPPSAAYMCQQIGPALFQIMACRLFGTKPLSKPMLGYCQLDLQGQTSLKFYSKYKTFYCQKCIWKYRLPTGTHLSRGRWVDMINDYWPREQRVTLGWCYLYWKIFHFDYSSINSLVQNQIW